MPPFLRQDAVRLLEAGLDCLNLAITGLGIPRRNKPRVLASEYATEIGLIGSAAELALSASYVQAYGPERLTIQGRHFKTAAQVIDEFSTLLKSPTPALAFLTKGIPDPEVHRKELVQRCKKLRLLATLRAGGLHAGRGPSREVCISLAKDISDLYELLG
jgi:hypothetical protein